MEREILRKETVSPNKPNTTGEGGAVQNLPFPSLTGTPSQTPSHGVRTPLSTGLLPKMAHQEIAVQRQPILGPVDRCELAMQVD